MIRIRPEWFPLGAVKKLHARSGGYKIRMKVGTNVYALDLSSDLGISPVFNIEDLVSVQGPTNPPDGPSQKSHPATIWAWPIFIDYTTFAIHDCGKGNYREYPWWASSFHH